MYWLTPSTYASRSAKTAGPSGLAATGIGELLREVRFLVRSDRERVAVHVLVRRRRAEELRQARAADVPQRIHQEQPVLGGGVALREHRRVARRAEDVGRAEALVADDGDVGGRRVDAVDVVFAHAERRVFEVVEDLLFGQPGRCVDEARRTSGAGR
jgi:hypothetical protein